MFQENYEVYGRRKIKAALRREYGLGVDKDRVARLMRELGIRGVRRGKTITTTKADKSNPRAPDLVNRDFSASRPNRLWVLRFHLRMDTLGLCLCGVHHRCLLQDGHRLAGLHFNDHRSSDGWA